MKTIFASAGGLAGACVLTAIHQLVKHHDAYHAPRMDLLGMESLKNIAKRVNVPVPPQKQLYNITMAADVLSNAIYYSAAGIGQKNTLLKGVTLGLAAGIGAVYLPQPLGLNPKPSSKTHQTQALAILYYLTGGVIAAGVMGLISKK